MQLQECLKEKNSFPSNNGKCLQFKEMNDVNFEWRDLNYVEIRWLIIVPSNQACAKLLGFEPLLGYGIEKWPKYRNRIGIGYEIARQWISILILFRNNELIDIGFDIDFEFLHVGILNQFRANILEGLCSKILVLKSILFRNISQN